MKYWDNDASGKLYTFTNSKTVRAMNKLCESLSIKRGEDGKLHWGPYTPEQIALLSGRHVKR